MSVRFPKAMLSLKCTTHRATKTISLERGGMLINDENYWPVKLKHRSTGHTKWVNLHSDERTVQSIVKETMANAKKSKINYCPK